MQDNKLYHIACTECGGLCGTSWRPLPQPDHVLCQRCQVDFSLVSDGLGCHDGLGMQDFTRLQREHNPEDASISAFDEMQHSRGRLISWCNSTFEKLGRQRSVLYWQRQDKKYANKESS